MNLNLQNRFSKAAPTYYYHSGLQRRIANEFLQWLDSTGDTSFILDIGCGTGFLCRRLKEVFGDKNIIGIDFALGMLGMAKNKDNRIYYIQSQAECISIKDKTIDLAVSNLAYQWVDDLGSAFQEVNRVLHKNGRFCFTVFTQNTLKELRESLNFVLPNNLKNQLKSIYSSQDILKILVEAGFIVIRSEKKIYLEFYPKLKDLLNWLKNIGANRYSNLKKAGLYGRALISEMSNYYESNFRNNGNIYATFEVFFVEAIKQ